MITTLSEAPVISFVSAQKYPSRVVELLVTTFILPGFAIKRINGPVVVLCQPTLAGVGAENICPGKLPAGIERLILELSAAFPITLQYPAKEVTVAETAWNGTPFTFADNGSVPLQLKVEPPLPLLFVWLSTTLVLVCLLQDTKPHEAMANTVERIKIFFTLC